MKTYAVYSIDTDRHYLLGYATGERRDIEIVFDHRKAYGLQLEEVNPIVVTKEFADEILKLRNDKTILEARLKEIDNQLKARKAL